MDFDGVKIQILSHQPVFAKAIVNGCRTNTKSPTVFIFPAVRQGPTLDPHLVFRLSRHLPAARTNFPTVIAAA